MPAELYRAANLSAIAEVVLGWAAGAAPELWAAQAAGWDAGDWECARWVAQVHGIGPLLHQATLAQPARAALHPLLGEYLAAQHRRSAARVGLLLGELAEILSACAAAGIAVMPLKGSLLATGYYAEPGLRSMNDLDLLVRPEDDARALELLGRLRYAPIGRSWKHMMLARPEGSGPVVAYDGEHPDNPRSLDLHTSLGERFWGIGYDLTGEAWQAARPGTLLGCAALIMPPELLLEHLLIHAASDMIARRVRLLHLHDIALVARRLDQTGWAALIAAARLRREERFIYPALDLAQRYFAIAPPEVLTELRPGVPAALRTTLAAHGIERFSFLNSTPSTFREKLAWYRPGREQLAALRHMALPDPGEVATWYPRLARPALMPLAYACYGAQMLGWGVRRLLRKPRLHLAAERMGVSRQA